MKTKLRKLIVFDLITRNEALFDGPTFVSQRKTKAKPNTDNEALPRSKKSSQNSRYAQEATKLPSKIGSNTT